MIAYVTITILLYCYIVIITTLLLCYNNVRSGGKYCKGCDNGEQGEGDQAEPVQHHRSKLPVALHRPGLLVVPDLVGDDLDLLEDETELPVQGVTGRARPRLL